MKKCIDSKIVVSNNEKYLVYLKQVPVRETKNGRKEIIRAFVKRQKKNLGPVPRVDPENAEVNVKQHYS